ncbi:hypothetical protein E1258_15780 [Micromonospora sp. KC207]|uniref:hypothetical protein n=1 Tax=Micromonospora sp. KC207 TaxID=2530377 RepID=UPI00104C12EC|nr:hypothetical protein [Micromonospora sp. KC207]TDC60101.1 hypothetical protein E1258_15780 [Micromonospora sp. KC207]
MSGAATTPAPDGPAPRTAGGWRQFTVEGDREAQDSALALLAAVASDFAVLRDRAGLRVFCRPTAAAMVTAAGQPFHTAPAEVAALPVPDEDLPVTGPAASGLIEEFLTASGPLVASLAADVRNGSLTRTDAGFDIMVAHLVAVARYLPRDDSAMGTLVRRHHPIPLSFPSVSAHADGMIALSGGGAALRAQLRKQYSAAAPVVERRVRSLLAQLQDGGPAAFDHAQRWHDLVDGHRRKVQDALERGELWAVTEDGEVLPDPGIGALHALTAAVPALRDYLATNVGYLSMRFMMGLLYLSLHAGIGLGMSERMVLCNAIGRSMEAVGRRGVSELMTGLISAISADAAAVAR